MQTICPYDYQEAGDIIDDELHDILVKPLPEGARLTCLFDCNWRLPSPPLVFIFDKLTSLKKTGCNSGTGMDLPYYCTAKGPKGDKKTDKKQKAVLKQMQSEGGKEGGDGLVVLFSGCPDGDCSADLIIDGQNCGVLVNSFAGLLRNSDFDVSYLELLYAMRVSGKENVGWVQIPQLSFNQADFDIEAKFSFGN